MLELRTLLSGHAIAATNHVGTDLNGHSVPDVLSVPVITLNPVSQSINSGATVTFNAAATGNPAPKPQWEVSTNGGSTWTKITGAKSTSYSFTVSSSENGYKYRALFTNSQGDLPTTAATLTVVTLTVPTVTTNPVSQSINTGAMVTFTAAATGNPAPTAQWQMSTNGGTTWTKITGATSTSYSFTVSPSENGYKYRALFTNSQGDVPTTAATLTVLTGLSTPTVTTNPVSQSIKSGLTVTFTAAAVGNPVPTAQWQVSTNGGSTWTKITGATSTTYSFTVSPSENGDKYRAIFTNSQGDLPTTAATLTIVPTNALLHNFGNLGMGGVFYLLGNGPNGSEFFELSQPNTGDVQLWSSTGTSAGTVLLHDFGNLGNAGTLDALQQLGSGASSSLVFTSVDFATMNTQLWGSNGTAAGTVLLHNFGNLGAGGVLQAFDVVGPGGGTYSLLESVNSNTNDTELWGTNATAAGTALLHDFGNLQATGGLAVEGSAPNGSVLFESNNSTTEDTQLWASNGIVSGTLLMHDFGALGNNVTFLSSISAAENGSLLLQSVNLATGDNQLWVSSGTVAGTILLHDYGNLAAGNMAGDLNLIGRVSNGIVLLEAFNSVTTETQLWATDGTVAGTILIQDLGERGLNNNLLLGIGNAPDGSVLFAALNTASEVNRLWKSNGTLAGTAMIHNFGNLGAAGFVEGLETASNGTRMFTVYNDSTGETQLWSSDGTPAGTIALTDLGTLGMNELDIDAVNLVGTGTNVSGLFETYNSPTGDVQLWDSHGTVASTIMLHDFGGAPLGGLVSDIGANLSGMELLQWSNPTNGDLDLWVSNGTVAGTQLLHDFPFVGNGAIIYLSTASNGGALLQMDDPSSLDTQLWASNGTLAGTTLLHDFGMLSLSPVSDELTGTNDPGLVAVLNTSTNDVQLWKSNGTVAGTQLVIDSGSTYNTFTFTADGDGLFDITTVTSTNDTELLLISP